MAMAADDDFEEEECISDDCADPVVGNGEALDAGAAVAIGGAMCPFSQHRFYRDHCMVCMFCHECTGYGSSCVSSLRPYRMPGQ